MSVGRIIGLCERLQKHRFRAVLPILLVVLSALPAWPQNEIAPRVALPGSPEPIYSPDPNDPWNRIFYFLFSRRMEVRLSDEFPEGAPFRKEDVDVTIGRRLLSTRTFDRTEVGDRPIDPFYPSSHDATGPRMVLGDSIYPEFRRALQDALTDKAPRTPLARALMQSDLWAAHDLLFAPFLPGDEKLLGARRLEAVDLLARLVRKTALTREEINSLPGNYPAAMQQHAIPDLFRKESGWIEVQWFRTRTHDGAAGFRRVSRIFVKPAHPTSDLHRFLATMTGHPDNPDGVLDGVALVMQLLVIDTQGNVRPTTIASDVQIRLYEKANQGTFTKTSLKVCELSRKLLLRVPGSGGLISEDENSPVYFGGYEFASGGFEFTSGEFRVGPPIQIRLRTRCSFCHGKSLKQVLTFSIALPPHAPSLRQLDPAAHEEADFDIEQKKKEKDYQALRDYFDRVPAAGTYH
jgi:hypothetical protein